MKPHTAMDGAQLTSGDYKGSQFLPMFESLQGNVVLEFTVNGSITGMDCGS
jgi:hypothetical protein